MTGSACRPRASVAAAILAISLAFCGCDANARLWDDAGASHSQQQISSPVTEHATYEELCDALGYTIPRLQYVGLDPKGYASIDGNLGEISYEADGGRASVTLREQPGVNEDISGVHGVALEKREMEGAEIRMGSSPPDTMVAWFTHGDTSYSLSSVGVPAADFENLVGGLLTTVMDGQNS